MQALPATAILHYLLLPVGRKRLSFQESWIGVAKTERFLAGMAIPDISFCLVESSIFLFSLDIIGRTRYNTLGGSWT